MLRLLPLFLSLFLIGSVVDGCAAKKKKKPASVEVPPDSPPPAVTPNGSPVPPPQEPGTPTTPEPKPQDPNNPVPTPTPIPTTPIDPGTGNPLPPLQPVPLDPVGNPIIPRTPIVVVPHVILNNGVVSYYTGRVSSAICQDPNVKAYYVPCPTNNGLYCWGPKCGYFTCVRWGW